MLWQWRRMVRLAAFSLVATSSVVAETRTEIGVLTCALAEPNALSESATTQSARNVLCWFRPFRNGPEETYRGTVAGAGQERELFKRHVMIWLVRAQPTTQSSPGLLQQSYAADPGAPLGYAPSLIGEARPALVLEPLAEQEPPVLNNKALLDAIIGVELILISSVG
jgi:hypothetical protein